jgi:hypothetical protein
MNTHRLASSAVLVASLVAIACGGGPAMNDAPQSLQGALSDARAENERHLSACQDAQSMLDMTTELDRYEDTMPTLLDRFDEVRVHMSHCSGGNVAGMSRSMIAIRSELSSRTPAIRKATSLGDAQAACTAEGTEIGALMSDMMRDLGGMSCGTMMGAAR